MVFLEESQVGVGPEEVGADELAVPLGHGLVVPSGQETVVEAGGYAQAVADQVFPEAGTVFRRDRNLSLPFVSFGQEVWGRQGIYELSG